MHSLIPSLHVFNVSTCHIALSLSLSSFSLPLSLPSFLPLVLSSFVHTYAHTRSESLSGWPPSRKPLSPNAGRLCREGKGSKFLPPSFPHCLSLSLSLLSHPLTPRSLKRTPIDMAIYGEEPAIDSLSLVVCGQCGRVVKSQALLQHKSK